MTIQQAIEQLDWYFEADDGTGADPITKEAYETLKGTTESKKNVFDNAHSFLEEYIKKPIGIPTKEEASERLTKLGVLDKDGKIANEWKDIIVKKPE